MKAYSVTVGASAVMIAPPRFIAGNTIPPFSTWKAGEVVVNGDLRFASNGRLYFCLVDGTCATEPTGAADAISIDSGIQWIVVPQGERKEINVTNTGATSISVEVGSKPTDGQGQVLNAGGGSYNTREARSQPVYAISNAAGGIVAVQEL